MAGNPILTVDIVTDASRATRGLDEVDTKLGKFNSAAKKAAVPAAAIAGGLFAIGKDAADAASRLEQSRGAIDKVFGGATAAKVDKWATDAAKKMGLSTAAYEEFSSTSGAMLKNLGFDTDAAAEKSNDLIQMGADLAATFGGETSVAVDALGASLRGEYDSLEQFGIKISAAAVAAEVAKEKQDGLTFASDNAATAAATLKLITDQAATSTGAYAAEADTAAGSQQTVNAEWENAKASLGDVLLPIIANASTKLGELIGWVEQNKDAVQKWAEIIGIAAVAILLYNIMLFLAGVAIGIWKGIVIVATGVQKAFNLMCLANPVLLVVAAVALLAIAVFFYRDEIAKAIKPISDFYAVIKENIPAVAATETVIGGMGLNLESMTEIAVNATTAISNLITWLDRLAGRKISGTAVIAGGVPPGGRIAPPGGFVAPQEGRFAAPEMLNAVAPPVLTSGGTSFSWNTPAAGNTTIINVSGALDPDAVARQIDRLLTARSRRSGSVAIG